MNSSLKKTFPLVLILLIVFFVSPAMAVDYNPGVSAGEWVKYGNYVVTTPAEAATNPSWSMIEVAGVSGKEVTLSITGEFENGTAITPSQLTCNIETGMTSGHQRYLIAANLNQGDPILISQGSDTINKTETRTYLGVSRSVNILNFTSSMPGQNIRVTYIYDKASGMNLEMEMEITIIEPAATYVNSYSTIDTNIFATTPTPTPDPTSTPTSTPTPTPKPTLTPTSTPTSTPAPTPTPTPTPKPSQAIPLEWIMEIVVVIIIITIIGVLLIKRRK